MRAFATVLLMLTVSAPALGIDAISCLAAKSKFKACSALSDAAAEDLPVRSCLDADSGYADCRTIEGPGSHTRCLATKGQYKACREWHEGVLTHVQCARADSGFNDCVAAMGDPMLCFGVKGGYKACRETTPPHGHQECIIADKGYADCRTLGGAHSACLTARRSYKYCRIEDRQSELFCTRVGKGYQECRRAGYDLAHCIRADEGFADCVAYRPPPGS